MTVQLRADKILIRSADLILAEHEPAARPGSCIADKAHLQELWKRSTPPSDAPLPSWQIRFDQAVVVTSLSVYEEEVA